jgi:hypothetical protein
VRTPRSLTRWRLLAVPAAALMALALLAAPTADAVVAPAKAAAPSVAHAIVGQQAANAVAATVSTNTPGFAGVEVNPNEPGVTVYWHGRPPASVTTTATASAHANRVKLRFLSAPYSLAQLLALRSAINRDPGFYRSGIALIFIYAQATGLYIGVANGNSAKARELPAIASTTIPVHYFAASVTPLSVPGRYKDAPPFSGGAFIYTVYAGKDWGCSSGFGMHFTSNPKEFFMLTAAHCMAESELGTEPFWVDGSGLKVGQTFYWSPSNDTVSLATVVGVKGAGGGHTIYLGPTSLTSTKGQSRANVLGAESVDEGDNVYTSGAYSGSRGPAEIQVAEAEWDADTLDGTGYTVFGEYAKTLNKSAIAGQGDSGGPVYVPVKGGVKAVGLISAAPSSTTAPCVGIMGRTCYYGLLFPEMTGTETSIEDSMNITVNTP